MLNPNHKLFRWGPISACPLFMYYPIVAAFGPMPKMLGHSYSESVITFQNDKVTWFLDNTDFTKASDLFVRNFILDDAKRKRFLMFWQERTDQLVKHLDHLTNFDFATASNSELAFAFTLFSKIYFDWWAITIAVELYASIESMLGEKLKQYYPGEHPKALNQAFAILTSPPILSFYRIEQKELLRIAALPKREQAAEIKVHQKKWYWIYNSYLQGQILDEQYFSQELEKLSNADYQAMSDQIETYEQTIHQQKEAIVNAIHPDAELTRLMTIFDQLSPLQDQRKMYNFQADHFLELFAQSFAKLSSQTVRDSKLLLPDELAHAFERDYKDRILKRRQAFVIECNDKQTTYIEGEPAHSIMSQFDQPADIDEGVIHGVLASTGEKAYFRGTAKIILDINNIGLVEEGDILITTMTSPDFVIGMKKAGAIITDIGGILCHAAIVSRELKKPCIVGTQIATKVIKDGDIIELHCGRATVKIIKHSTSS